jgi:hypothetical protein
MNKKNVLLIVLGVLVGWITVPILSADQEGNTYKALLRKMIEIVTQVEVNTAQTAANTKAIKEHFGIK